MIALVSEHFRFVTPVDRFRLPVVDATASKTESFESHAFESDVSGEDHQVTPRKFLAVFFV